jgi:hypothetical protein
MLKDKLVPEYFNISIWVAEERKAAREETVTIRSVDEKFSDLNRSTIETIKGRIVEMMGSNYLIEMHLKFGSVVYKILKN